MKKELFLIIAILLFIIILIAIFSPNGSLNQVNSNYSGIDIQMKKLWY